MLGYQPTPPPGTRHPPDPPGPGTPLWTHACKNITFATSLRTVITVNIWKKYHSILVMCHLQKIIQYFFYNSAENFSIKGEEVEGEKVLVI